MITGQVCHSYTHLSALTDVLCWRYKTPLDSCVACARAHTWVKGRSFMPREDIARIQEQVVLFRPLPPQPPFEEQGIMGTSLSFVGLFAPSSRRSRLSRRPRRKLELTPQCEHLEIKIAPATFTWTGAGGNALWSNGGNWDRGVRSRAIPLTCSNSRPQSQPPKCSRTTCRRAALRRSSSTMVATTCRGVR